MYCSLVSRDTVLRRDLKQKRPFRSDREAAIVALLLTADHVKRQLISAIEPFGVTLQQFNVLRILRGGGPEGVPTLDVADRMLEQTPGITRLLDRLEAKGLVHRRRCRKDRRQHLCWITEAGESLLESMDAPLLETVDRALAGLAQDGAGRLIGMLDHVRHGRAP